MNPSPNLEPRPAGNYQATCPGYLPESTKAAPRDLHADLARLDERLLLLDSHLDAVDHGNDWSDVEDDLQRARDLLEIIRTEASAMPTVSDVECGYEGPVDAEVQSLGGGTCTMFWTCPRCGTENADERDGDDA